MRAIILEACNQGRKLKDLLFEMFRTAVAATHPRTVLPSMLSGIHGPVVVIGAGKAAVGMAEAAEDALDVSAGAVVTRHGQGAGHACRRIRVLEAGHPLPDDSGVAAARTMLDLAASAARIPGATLLCLLSGGGSALMSLPPPGVTIAEKADMVRRLLSAGVPIDRINCVRRHLSLIKGGRLALKANPARVLTLAISDVVGDSPADIASGPTVPDATSSEDAMAVIRDSSITVSPAIIKYLVDPSSETPFPGDPRLAGCEYHIVACGDDAIAAAASLVTDREVINLGASISGDSRAAAALHAKIVRDLRRDRRRAVILSGGETTTVIRGPGIGGSNSEFLLALAMELRGVTGVGAMAADTDGMDGRGGHAGAWFGPDFLHVIDGMGAELANALDSSDSASFLDRFGLLLVTGATGTNVNDFRVIIVD